MSEPFDEELTADAYLMRRLALTRRAKALPASVQFDLARAPIPDDQLEGVLGEFGVELGNGFGIADIANRLLSGQPDTKAVADIKQLQSNLRSQGYLPASYNPTGIWSDQDYVALRQADRDAMDAQRSGNSLLAAPVATGMRLITDTLPSRVWQGVVGAAKGLAQQGQETAERVGLLGGVAGGAAIGAAAGSVVPGIGTAIGAGVGAAAGGVIGFFGDLLGEEDDEENQSGWADVLDALQPFNEYTGKEGVHQFFEDLSFVGTAASLAGGVGLATKGVTGGIAAARGIAAGVEVGATPSLAAAEIGSVGKMSLGRALLTPSGAKSTSAIAMALEHPVATGGVLGGFTAMGDPNAGITDILEGAAFGAAGGLVLRAASMGKLIPGSGNWVQALRGFQDAHSLITRPIFQLANGAYTGAAAASIGARLSSGELLDAKGPAPTTIAKAIRETPLLSTGMEIPIAGDLIDVASFILYPTQLLPAKAGDLARAFDGMMGEAGLKPWIGLAQHNDLSMTVGKARTAIREFFGTRKAFFTKIHMDAAAEIEAIRLLNEKGIAESQNAIAFKRTVAEVKKTMKGDREYTGKLMAEVLSDSERLQAWALHHMGGDGPFLDNLHRYDEVEQHLNEFQREAKRLGTLVDEQPNSLSAIMQQQPGGSIRPVQPTVVPSGYVQENANRLLLTERTRELRARKQVLEMTERSLNKQTLPTQARLKAHQEISSLKLDIRQLEAEIEGLKATTTRRKRLADEMHIVGARKDTHTRNTIFEAKKRYVGVRDEFREAFEDVRKIEDLDDPIAAAQVQSRLAVKQQEFESAVTEMLDGGLITPNQAKRVLDKGGKGKASRDIENSLEAQALVAARDIELPSETMRFLDERGYKPVVTGDEVFVTPEIEDLVELLQVGNYSRRRNFVESIGLGTRQASEENLYKTTHTNMVNEVDQVLQSGPVPVPLRGSAALKRLQTYLEAKNAKAVVEFPVIGPIATALKFKADIRRLSPSDIEEALGGIRGVTSEKATEIYQALKRGAAFGQDFELLHPIRAARQIGRANRVSGLPGFSQVIRSWHVKNVDPFALKRTENVLAKEMSYTPPADLANSRERARVISEARASAQLVGMHGREIRESERLLDVMAETATRLRPDLYKNVDDFYRGVGINYAEQAEELMAGALRQYDPALAPRYPEMQDLMDLATRYEDGARWYHDSAIKIAEIFSSGTSTLRDGRVLNDYELFKQLLAVTSPQQKVADNMANALRAITEYKKTGKTLEGFPGPAGKNIKTMVDDILNGHTMDRWAPMTAKELESVNGMSVVDTKLLRTERNLDTSMAARRTRDAEGGTPVRSKAELDSLKETMAKEGWGEHFVMAELGANGKVTIIDGTHRLMLAEELGMKKIPVRWNVSNTELAERTQAYLAKKKFIGGRPKVRNFYNNLLLSEDHVTVDVWMARLFRNQDEVGGEYGTIAQEIRDVANRIGYSPAQTQAMLWVGFKKEYTAKLEEARAAAIAAGDMPRVKALNADIKAGKRASTFADVAEMPRIRELITEYEGSLGKRLLQKTEDGVRGSIQFGPEYQSSIHLYSTGAFDTLVHEGAHLIRRILPDDELKAIEASYGVKRGELWPVEAEERFAEDFTAFMMGKYKGSDAGAFGSLRSSLATLWARNRDGFLDAGVVPLGMHRKMNELFRKDIEKLGLKRSGSSVRSKQVLAGAALGAVEGGLTGDSSEDILRGALYGAGVGLGAKLAAKKSYGYLPDALANLNMTLRYTLSFTFDLGRHMEQRMIAGAKYGLPSFGSPNKHLGKNEWLSPYRDGKVSGDTAIADANRFFDEVNGTNYFAALQEFEQRNFQRGLLGFAPREYEVVQAFQLYQRGWDKAAIKEAVANIGRYGLTRTNFERSVNFVFFPFSFQKKLLSTLRDFIFQAPGRNLLIHEGLRRYHDSLVDDEFHSLIEDRLPLLEQIWMVNNLAFGASLGRFFMEGITDRRTKVGEITQILSSFFIPSGAATPLQQAFGAAGDLSVGAFTPVVITGESLSRAGGIDGLDDIVRRYVPFVREIDKWAQTLNDQKVAALSPQHLTPYSQMQEYYEARDAMEEQYEPLATAMGYSSVDGFLNSPTGLMFKAQLDEQSEELRLQYPQGWEITTQFENDQAIDAAALQDLARKPDKSEGEEAFLELIQRQQALQQMAQYLPEETVQMMTTSAIRSFSLRWVNDRRFAELYDRFMTRDYGPIRRVS